MERILKLVYMFIIFTSFMCCNKPYDSVKYCKQKTEIIHLMLSMLNFTLMDEARPQSTMLYESGQWMCLFALCEIPAFYAVERVFM